MAKKLLSPVYLQTYFYRIFIVLKYSITFFMNLILHFYRVPFLCQKLILFFKNSISVQTRIVIARDNKSIHNNFKET